MDCLSFITKFSINMVWNCYSLGNFFAFLVMLLLDREKDRGFDIQIPKSFDLVRGTISASDGVE